ncbi:MAG: hypothetical protein J6S85_15850 [Methanobrevibacter sp.]|nr:hypothetical protein [Methanobrevibacter sp.]
MSSATQTLLGLYQIGKARNKNFFDKLTFPDGIDHDLAVANILHEAGDCEVLYNDLDLMANACELFSAKWRHTFEKWLAVMNIDYEPLENYNRLEHWSDSESTSESTSTSTSDATSNSATTDNDISAFNESTLQNDTSAATTAETAGHALNQSKHDRLNYFDHEGRVHGNIGVTTTQAMYLEEWELSKLNLYHEIYVLFGRELLIPFSY